MHNRRFYYNPITSLLEPIGFDALGYHFVEHPFEVSYSFPEDQEYRNLVLSKLYGLMKMDYKNTEELFEKKNFLTASFLLSSEYPKEPNRLKDLMKKRYEKITSIYGLNHPMDIYLEDIDKDSIVMKFRNVTKLDIEILGLKYKKKHLAGLSKPLFIRESSFKTCSLGILEGGFNTFFSKSTKRINRSKFQDIEIYYRVVGTEEIKKKSIIPYPYHNSDYIKGDIMRKKMNLGNIPFIKVNEESKIVSFLSSSSTWKLNKPLRIEKGYRVVVPKNFRLDIQEGGLIISRSPIFFRGEPEAPIEIYSSDGKGGGMIVLQSTEKSEITHTTFDKLTIPSYGSWFVTGAVTFYESPISLKNVIFRNNLSEDALNIVKSSFSMDSTYFYNTKADAFDGDFVTGPITNSYFENIGNDAIDISGSQITVDETEIINARDKAISVGEKSMAKVNNVSILNSEIAINTKDLSTTNVKNMMVKNTNLIFTAFQKKDEFGPGKILVNNVSTDNIKTLHLIEEGSLLSIDGKLIKETVKEVKERMYGNDYGRKSD